MLNSPDRAILDIKIQRDKLQQYQKRITTITDRETAVAKSCLVKGDKKRALLALRRKKFQESLLAKTDAQLATLEQLTANIEFALVQKDVMYGLKQGTDVLKQINAEMGGIDKVEQLMGESEEAREYQRQVSEMLEAGLSRADEEDVEEELDKLEQGIKGETERIDNKATEGTLTSNMPNVPGTEPVFAKELRDTAFAKKRVWERKAAEAFEVLPA